MTPSTPRPPVTDHRPSWRTLAWSIAALLVTLALGSPGSTARAEDDAPGDDVSAAGREVRVAVVSFVPRKFDVAYNTGRLERAFRAAGEQGAELAVAPEGIVEGYVVNEILAGKAPWSRMREVARAVDSATITRFRDLARELGMCLVFGFAELDGGDVFNTAVFVGPQGDIHGKYRKMQLHEGYHDSWWFNRLGARSRAFDTPLGRCGMLICNDRWNPLLAKIPVLDGARLLIVPAYGSTSEAQDEAVLARARENGVPLVEANVGVALVVDGGEVSVAERRPETIVLSTVTVPPAVEADIEARDQAEAEFLAWRREEMPRRFERTLARHGDSARVGDEVGSANDEDDGAKSETEKPAGDGTDEGRVLLGAHYYPWYSGAGRRRRGDERGWMRQALRGRLVPRQDPAAGARYDSRDPEVIAAHIEQSRRAGIDFWSVSWWGPESREDVALREHILPHPDASHLKYAILYESTGRLGGFASPDYSKWVPDFEYMREKYFDHPSYLEVRGRPVVFVYLTREYFRGKGKDALDRLRAAVPEVYIVADDVFGPGYRAAYARLFDAVTAYDVYGQAFAGAGATQAGLDRVLRNFETARRVAGEVGTAFVPAISPGFNDRAVRDGHVGVARKLTDRDDSKEGDLFRESIRQTALPLVDPRADRMIVVTSFNEWYEDTQIEATTGENPPTARDDSESGTHYTEGDTYVDYGTLYLDILREEIRERGAEKRAAPAAERDAEDEDSASSDRSP